LLDIETAPFHHIFREMNKIHLYLSISPLIFYHFLMIYATSPTGFMGRKQRNGREMPVRGEVKNRLIPMNPGPSPVAWIEPI